MENLDYLEIDYTQNLDSIYDKLVEISDLLGQINFYLQLLVYLVVLSFAGVIAWHIWLYVKSFLRSFIKFPI